MSDPFTARARWRAFTGGVGVSLLLLCGALPVQAAPLRVAIVVHPVVNVPEAESRAIATELAAAMRKRYDAEVVAGDAVRTKMPSNLPEDCVSQAACIGEVGDRVGADQVLFLVMFRVGDKVQVDATWAEVQTGRVLARDTVQLPAAAPERSRILTEVAPIMIPRGEAPLLAGAPSADLKPAIRPEGRLPDGPKSDLLGESPSAGLDVTELAWVSAAVSAASLGVGVALVLGGLADYQEQIEIGCPSQAEPRGRCAELVDAFGTRSTASNLLFLGAALAGATSVALFAASASPTTTAAVVVTPDGAGLTLGGHF